MHGYLPPQRETVETADCGPRINSMHGRTAGEEANPGPLASELAARYDGAKFDGCIRASAHLHRFLDRHVGATETMSSRYFLLFVVCALILAPSAASRKIPSCR